MADSDREVLSVTSPPSEPAPAPAPAPPPAQRYGWGRFTPDCLQFLNSPFWFLIIVCVAVTAESMLVNGLVAVSISSIETRFDLSSSQAGAIPSVYELGGIPCMLFIGLCGSVLNRPRWIGTGMLLLGVAGVIYTLPHFITDLYNWGGDIQDNLCHPDNNITVCGEHVESSTLSHYLYMFITATLLMSVGTLPLYLLGVPFVDDSLASHAASCYLGVFYAMSSLGPAIAYIAGGMLLQIYTDFNEVDMDGYPLESDDPRWVGAWWIGFLFTSVLCLITVLPIVGFPNVLPGTEEIRKTKMAANMTKSSNDVMEAQPGFTGTCKEFPSILKDLLTNLTFVFSSLAHVGDSVIVVGFASFGPKYIENQFSISASLASMLFGVTVIPGAVGGTILGGWIIKRWKLSCLECLRGYVILGVTVFAVCGLFFIRCKNAPFVGVSTFPEEMASSSGQKDIYFNCNDHCRCSTEKYAPICGSDNLVYFSPCFAGCQLESDRSDNVYENCSCIQNGSHAKAGVCDSSYCELMPLFLILLLVAMVIIFVAGIFHLQIGLRCVRGDSRPLAMSVDTIIGRLGGSFPGPLLYGAALDGSCILWEETCDQKGSCLYYDNHQMAWYMIALGLGCKLFNIFFAFLAWMVYKHKRPDQMEPQILREVSHSINSHREYVHETSRDGETEPVEDGAVNVAFVGTGDFSDQQMGKSDYSTFT